MGGKAVEKKKKKGRPSLLDLQKRNLRQQQQQQQELQQKQNPNPYIRNPNPNSTRRSTRRNPNLEPEAAEDDDDEGGSKRREKKLKLVLRLPSGGDRGSDDGGSARSESDGGDDRRTKKRKVGDFGEDHKSERHNSASKATNAHPGEPSNSGPTTPLPDEKLLVFILDRLQKKDTYGVFSDPVDPDELPDYHEVIEHPMDFSTVRKKLSDGAYANLEQFENDVFLISSNAMRYNSPDTIYFRQARGIQELAEKNFENLRQDSDDEEPEPKVVRRGRPPSKNIIKRTVGRPPIDRASSDFSSNATLANAGDNGMWSNSSNDVLRRGAFLDKPGMSDVSTRYGLRNSDPYGWLMDGKPDKNDELTGSGMKGMSMKLEKKNIVIDENRRNTHKLAQQLSSGREPSVLTFEEEKKQLLPVGFHTEHAYARSLARFVVGLGPTAWNVASRKIQRSLPPGVKFGIGWVGEYEPPPSNSTHTVTLPQPPQPQLEPSCSQIKSPPSSLASHTPKSHKDEGVIPERHELSINPSTAKDIHSSRDTPPPLPTESNGNIRKLNYESGLGPLSSGGSGTRPKTPPQHFQLHQNPLLQTTPINGFNNGFGFNLNQVGNMGGPVGPGLSGCFSRGGETMPTTHSRMLDMVSRGNSSLIHHQLHPSRLEVEKANEPQMRPSTSHHHSQGLWRGLQQKQQQLNPGSAPPDLNVRFQSPSSPTPSSLVVDSQHPDLALQL